VLFASALGLTAMLRATRASRMTREEDQRIADEYVPDLTACEALL
jgi:hypothetical protein